MPKSITLSDIKTIPVISNLFNTVYKAFRFILKNSVKIITLTLTAQALLSRTNASAEENQNGMTPLHVAAEAGDFFSVQALVNGGADIHAEDNDSMTPLDLACNVLETHSFGGPVEDLVCVPLENHLPALKNHISIVDYLTSKGALSFCTVFNSKKEELFTIEETTNQNLRS